MKSLEIATPEGFDCWNRIGISGDRSCPELEQHIHCRNCPVFATAAQSFFDRSAPPGYLAEWARMLAAPVEPADSKDLSLLMFRLCGEWLAFQTRIVVEVTTPRPVHRIPHRSNEILIGLVNLRGQLQLQVSLHGLLGVDSSNSADGSKSVDGKPRLVVVKREGQTWVFLTEEVLGVYRFARGSLTNVPSTLANPANSFSHALIHWHGKSVGYLDDRRVFESLKGIAQ